MRYEFKPVFVTDVYHAQTLCACIRVGEASNGQGWNLLIVDTETDEVLLNETYDKFHLVMHHYIMQLHKTWRWYNQPQEGGSDGE